MFGLLHQEEMQEQVVQVEAETQTIQEVERLGLLEQLLPVEEAAGLQEVQLQDQVVLVEAV